MEYLTYNKKKIKIALIGLGYVGLPLAIEFSKKYEVVGYDKDGKRIKQLKKGLDVTLEIDKETLISKKNLILTDKVNKLKSCNIYIITVPTPIDKFNKPNLEPLKSASLNVGNFLDKNDIVIYESTVYPGATEEFCVPILESASNLIYNKDFFCGYSPERINPGDKNHSLVSIVKVTSGSNKGIANFIDKLYKTIIKAGTFMAESISVAEAAKVIENTQRDVNIALMNELSIIFNKLNIDTNQVLEAASTKWNFLNFKPGLVGGHCIGVDPYYLTHKSLEAGYNPEVILAGRRINDNMSKYIIDVIISKLINNNVNPRKAKIGIFGLTFKENCPDLRNTKVEDIYNYLLKYKCQVFVTDEFADKKIAKDLYNINLYKIEDLIDLDVAVLAVEHSSYKNLNIKWWKSHLKTKSLFIDIKSIYSKDFFAKTNIDHWRL